jgi:RNA polymerase sigma-70 factor (ECF subfamily)
MSDRPSRPLDYEHEKSMLLLEHARAGDERALEALLTRYLPQLRRWASGRLPAGARSLQDTGDLVQDAMLRTIHKVRDFVPEHDGAFMAYLRQAVLNRIRDEARRMVRRPDNVELGSAHLDPRPSPLEDAIGAQSLERYEAALARLGEAERQADGALVRRDRAGHRQGVGEHGPHDRQPRAGAHGAADGRGGPR